MRATSVVLLGLCLVPATARAQSDEPDAADAQAADSDPAAALLAECSNGEENDRCSLLEAVVTNNLIDDLETLYWAADQRSVPVALDALTIDDPRIQLAALLVLQQFSDADGVGDAVEPLLFTSTMVVPSAAALVLDWGASGLPAYLGGLYRGGHGDEAWTDEDNLFTPAPVPDPTSGGYTLADGLTPCPPVDFFDTNFSSAGFTTSASVDTVAAFYASALGTAPVDFWDWALGFLTDCANSGTTGHCAFEPLLDQFSYSTDDPQLRVVEAADANPAKVVMVHADATIGTTIVRLAWLAPTALPQPIPTLPDDEVGPTQIDGGVAPDAALPGSLVDAGQAQPGTPATVPPATAKKSSGCQVTKFSSSRALSPIFPCLAFVLWLAARRTRKSG